MTHLGHPQLSYRQSPAYALIVSWLSSARGHFVTGERVERRLVAVLAADVAGYSCLMGADETGKVTKPCKQRHVVAAAAGRHVP
jgi:class 3 adenylate cyclase